MKRQDKVGRRASLDRANLVKHLNMSSVTQVVVFLRHEMSEQDNIFVLLKVQVKPELNKELVVKCAIHVSMF